MAEGITFEDRSFHLDRLRGMNHYEVLDIKKDASFDEINYSYKRALLMFDPLSVATYSILDQEENAVMLRMVESAYATLRDPVERRKYDRDLERTSPAQPAAQPSRESWAPSRKHRYPPTQSSFPFLSPVYTVQPEGLPITDLPEIDAVKATFSEISQEYEAETELREDISERVEPAEAGAAVIRTAQDRIEPQPEQAAVKTSATEPAPEQEQPAETGAMGAAPPVDLQTMETMPPAPATQQAAPQIEIPEIGPDTVFSGELIKKLRILHRLELSDVAAIIKITRSNIENIEKECYAELPATVYLKGHLAQYAKALKLDPLRVSVSYIARMKEALAKPQED